MQKDIDADEDKITALMKRNAAKLLGARKRLQELADNFDIRKLAARVTSEDEELERLSADEKKRLEYETRLKYKRDKYAQLHYATRIGREEGERIGREEGGRIGREEGQSEMIRSMWKAGISEEQIASIAQKTVEEVRKLCK